MTLHYTGAGVGAFFPGVPARDLADDEVAALGGEEKLLVLRHLDEPLYVKTHETFPEPDANRGGWIKAGQEPREDGE